VALEVRPSRLEVRTNRHSARSRATQAVLVGIFHGALRRHADRSAADASTAHTGVGIDVALLAGRAAVLPPLLEHASLVVGRRYGAVLDHTVVLIANLRGSLQLCVGPRALSLPVIGRGIGACADHRAENEQDAENCSFHVATSIERHNDWSIAAVGSFICEG
jgi:hypothetical protein